MARNTKTHQGKKRAEREARQRQAHKKRLMRNGAIVGVVAISVAVFLVATWPEPDVGSTEAEAWDLPALVGDGRYALGDFGGEPTVAVFFASWCTVCEGEIPEFLAVSREIGDRVNFVGINSQDNGRGGGGDRRPCQLRWHQFSGQRQGWWGCRQMGHNGRVADRKRHRRPKPVGTVCGHVRRERHAPHRHIHTTWNGCSHPTRRHVRAATGEPAQRPRLAELAVRDDRSIRRTSSASAIPAPAKNA